MTGAKHTGPKTKEGVMAVQRETARRLLAGGGNIGGYGGVGSETDRTHEETDKGGAEMNGEIDRDFYCSRYKSPRIMCSQSDLCAGHRTECGCRHRKWPTPEQFVEEYGEEYPEDGAVYLRQYEKSSCSRHYFDAHYHLATYSGSKELIRGVYADVVCACTPWGKPPDDWRPE